MTPKLQNRLQGFLRTFSSLDLIVYGLIGTLIGYNLVHLKWETDWTQYLAYAWITLTPLVLTREIWEERAWWLKKYSYLFLLLAGAALVGMCYLFKDTRFPYILTHTFLFILGLGLLAPSRYFPTENKFTQWLMRVCLATVLAISVALLVFLLSFGLYKIFDILFSVQLPESFTRFYISAVLTLLVLVLLKYFVFQGRSPSEIQYQTPESSKKMMWWILLPIHTIYVVMLNVYAAKILFTWNLPKGWVSWPISIAYGLLFLIEIHSQLHSDQRLQKYLRFSRWAYIPLWILMAISIGTRISEYGFTEMRFMLLVTYIFLMIIWLGTVISKTVQLRRSLMVFMVYLLIFMIKPIQPIQISYRSQYNRAMSIASKMAGPITDENVLDISNWTAEDIVKLRESLRYISGTDWDKRFTQVLKKKGLLGPEILEDGFAQRLQRRLAQMKNLPTLDDSYTETERTPPPTSTSPAGSPASKCLLLTMSNGEQLPATIPIEGYRLMLNLQNAGQKIMGTSNSLVYVDSKIELHSDSGQKLKEILDLKTLFPEHQNALYREDPLRHVVTIDGGVYEFYFTKIEIQCGRTIPIIHGLVLIK